jgi:hypothetical protein
MKRGSKLREGTIFLVPLRDHGFGVGVIARINARGVALGYFFGPRMTNRGEVPRALEPRRALLVGQFGDLELRRGKWPLLGVVENWSPERWPVPRMARVDEVAQRAWLSTYDESLICVREEEIPLPDASRYPYDRLMGAGAVELRLTSLMKGEAPAPKAPAPE